MTNIATLLKDLRKALQTLEASTAEEDPSAISAALSSASTSYKTLKATHDLESQEDKDFVKYHDVYVKDVKEAKRVLRFTSRDKDDARDSAIVAAINLPRAELRPFSGDILEYPVFRSTFDELVHSAKLSDASKLVHLLRHTEGKAHDAIKACAFTDGGYEEARAILERRFGDKHAITHAFVRNIRHGKRVKTPDEILTLADDLAVCASTLRSLRTISEIESQDLILDVVQRLPSHSYHRWVRRAVDFKEEKGYYPSFEVLVEFVQRLASQESDPVYGNIGKTTQQPIQQPSPQQRSSRVSHAARASPSTPAMPPAASATPSTTRPATKCPLCAANHKLIVCNDFRALAPHARLDFVKHHSLCHICFYDNHATDQCKRPYVCSVEGCGLRHSKFVHLPLPIVQANSNTSVFSSSAGSAIGSFIPTVGVTVRGQVASAVLDSGSNATFVTRDFTAKLGLQGKRTSLNLSTLHGNRTSPTEVVDFIATSVDGKQSLHLTNVFVIDVIPLASPPITSLDNFPHLRDLDIHIHDSSFVQILIGQDNGEALVPLDVRRGQGGLPFAVKTFFGWSLNGPLHNLLPRDTQLVSHFVMTSNSTDADDSVLERIEEKLDAWMSIDNEISSFRSPSVNDRRVLEFWDSNAELLPDGHFQLPIPWKKDVVIPNNYQVALHRLQSTQRNLINRDLFQAYDAEIQKLIAKGHAERAPPGPSSMGPWYVPHHLVLNPKKPGKLRQVFDCAAKFHGQSLNDKCFSGPDLNNRLTNVLLRFRQYPVAYCADVEAMYYQVVIPPHERDVLRFLWFDSFGEVIELRMTRHLFGGIWCAASATYALRKSVEIPPGASKQAHDVILRSFYVDDCLRSEPNVTAAEEGATEVIDVLQRAGFHLTKFVANSREFLTTIL